MYEQVNDYIQKQKSPQKEIIQKIREIFLKTIPNHEERMRWGVITYGAGRFYVAAMKTRVHVGFAITGLSKDEIRLLEGSGKTMRHIKIPTLEDIDEEKIVNLIKIVDKKAICNSF